MALRFCWVCFVCFDCVFSFGGWCRRLRMGTACDCGLGCLPWCFGFLFVILLGVVVWDLLLPRCCFGLLIRLVCVLSVFDVCGCRWFVGVCV